MRENNDINRGVHYSMGRTDGVCKGRAPAGKFNRPAVQAHGNHFRRDRRTRTSLAPFAVIGIRGPNKIGTCFYRRNLLKTEHRRLPGHDANQAKCKCARKSIIHSKALCFLRIYKRYFILYSLIWTVLNLTSGTTKNTY